MDEIELEDTTLENGAEDGADTTDKEETVEELKARLEIETSKNAKLFARAKKAEGFIEQSDGTWLKKPEAKDIKPELISSDPIEVATLANSLRNLSPEEIDFAKKIAKGGDISLLEALKTDEFQIIHKAKVVERKKENAKLGASKGSGQNESNEMRSGMTKEEHMAAWEALN